MTDKELDDLFQHNLSGHQMPVPPNMWQRVNPQKDKRRRAIILWWSGLGVAALFVLAGVSAWLYHSSSTEQKQGAATATATASVKKASAPGFAKNTITGNPSSQADEKTHLPGIASEKKDSSLITQLSSKTKTQTPYPGIHQYNYEKKRDATAVIHQNSTNDNTNGIEKPKQDNSLVKNGQNNNEIFNSKSNGNPVPVSAADTNQATPQPKPSATPVQTPDSSALVTKNTTGQASKATAVKVKHIHGEKATSLELMVAGYGNSRHVYDANHFSAAGLVPSGFVNQKEKVLMNSFSITARIDKPLTKNFSFKTGLQFLQTRQQVSYHYETVSQTMFINSFSTDTVVLARLQSKQSLIEGRYNSLNVPVLFSYHTNGAKMNFGATAGLMLNVLSWYKGRVPDAGSGQVTDAKSAFRRHTGASLYAGLTASKQVGSFRVFAEPHIQYTLSSVTKSSASFRQKITGYGFGIGIRKTIGK